MWIAGLAVWAVDIRPGFGSCDLGLVGDQFIDRCLMKSYIFGLFLTARGAEFGGSRIAGLAVGARPFHSNVADALLYHAALLGLPLA
jgi:hypothetical protein